MPNFAWVHRLNEITTFGLSAMTVGGFKSNYPASLTNPVLAPPSNNPNMPGGLGSLYSDGQFMQIVPAFSFAVTERLSIGIAPMLTTGQIVADPLLLQAPDDADGSGVPTVSGRAWHTLRMGRRRGTGRLLHHGELLALGSVDQVSAVDGRFPHAYRERTRACPTRPNSNSICR